MDRMGSNLSEDLGNLPSHAPRFRPAQGFVLRDLVRAESVDDHVHPVMVFNPWSLRGIKGGSNDVHLVALSN
jgi:hypothetical protein